MKLQNIPGAPDHSGIFGIGESLTYGAQRILMSRGSLAREFGRGDISKVSPVNHGYPHYDLMNVSLPENMQIGAFTWTAW